MLFRPWRRGGVAALIILAPLRLSAQASPYIPLDDSRLALIEHLIARGEIDDPSPMVRPFRRADLLRVLDAARPDSTTPGGRMALRLRDTFRQDSTEAWWQVAARAGIQTYSNARRDVLHPAGPDGPQPYADVGVTAAFGPVIAVSRPALEPRVTDDPAWPGRTDIEVAFRMQEAYLSAQFKWFAVFFGDLQRNWGPSGLNGISLSDYSFQRTSWAFYLGKPSINLRAIGAELRDDVDSLGDVIHRYWFGHRVAFDLSSRFHAAVWETTVLSGNDRNFEARYRNPVSVLLLANTYGVSATGNVMVGADLQWRAAHWLTVQAQLAVDDIQYQNRGGPDRFPDRLAGTVAGFGPLGRTLAWRLLYTRASSLAFRTLNPFENFTDHGVGIGRNFADNDLVKASVSIPLRGRWIVSPTGTVLRQGQGRINDPIPADVGNVPQIFIGTVETTYRLGFNLSGRHGLVDVQADLGVNQLHNAGHQAGINRTEFQGWIQATLDLDWRGIIK